MSLLQELKLKYRLSTVSEKLIFVNLGIFAVIALINAFAFLLTKEPLLFFSKYLALPEDLSALVFKPWTFITYMFTHFGFKHVLFNMIMLYFSGRIFLVFFSPKQLVNYYFLGGIFGGIAFVAIYNLAPALLNDTAVLIGASASVFAILMGVTVKAPNYIVNLFGVFKIPLWVVSVLFIISFISLIPGLNTGGELAHLGGALLGYLYTSQLNKGKDIGKGFGKLLDRINNWVTSVGKSPLKTVHKTSKSSKFAGHAKKDFNEFNKQKQIDLILEKISKSGYESLSKAEKEFLFKAGKD